MDLMVTKRQQQFLSADCDEVLFGGAAGGGKSYGQLVDALLFAIKYNGSKQLVLRRTFPELKRSLILTALALFPTEIAKYNSSNHKWEFSNGSMIEFGYCDSESDVTKYQSAEYDIIRFDELTHFTEFQYSYLISRIRGVNNFPKQIKSSTNPGGIGHAWVKTRFIDGKEPNKVYTDDVGRTVVFIPAKVQDNKFLMNSDPNYVKRLEQLPENQKKALLFGDWDIFEGQVFTEWSNDTSGYMTRKWSHVISPFKIPREWRRYRSFDFGYSKPFSVGWFAVDYDGRIYHYRELYGCTGEPDVGIKWNASEIAKKIREIEDEEERGNHIIGVADPAIWNSTGSQEGSIAEMMEKCGVYFDKGNNNRLAGKMQVHYRLAFDEEGLPMFYVFENCRNFIRTIPLLQYDSSNPEDVDTKQEDHCITGNTLIWTDKGKIPIKELCGQDGYAYSHDNKLHKFFDVRLTQKNVDVYTVELEDGTKITATSNHKFMLKNGEWKEFHELTINDELMKIG